MFLKENRKNREVWGFVGFNCPPGSAPCPKKEEIGHFHNQPVFCFRLRDELVESQAEFLGSDIAKIMPEDESVAGTRPWLQRSGKSDAGG